MFVEDRSRFDNYASIDFVQKSLQYMNEHYFYAIIFLEIIIVNQKTNT